MDVATGGTPSTGQSGGGDTGGSSDTEQPTEGTEGGTAVPQGPGMPILAVHQNPLEAPMNCKGFDRNHLVIGARLGSGSEALALNVHRDSGTVLAACGAFGLRTAPHPNRWPEVQVTDGGTMVYFNMDSLTAHIQVPDTLDTCGDRCYSYTGFAENDIQLHEASAFDAAGVLVQEETGLIVVLGVDQSKSENVLVFDETGAQVPMELLIPPFWTVLEFGTEDVLTDRLLLRSETGGIGAAQEAAGLFAIQSAGGPVRQDATDYSSYGNVFDQVAVDSGFLVALGDADSAFLMHIDRAGTSTILGEYPAASDPETRLGNAGGRLLPNGCLYTQARGPAKAGLLIKRCPDGTYQELAGHPPCDPQSNICIVST